MPNLFGPGGLANQSVTFQNYFVAATACTPARSSLLTGLYSEQTCMFATQETAAMPSLQPWNQGGVTGWGFPTIGDALGQSLPVGNCSSNTFSNAYDTAWIGKWHVSDLDFTGTGKNGPSDYGFTSIYCLPTPAVQPSGTYPNPYPSPNGVQNEGTGGDTLGNTAAIGNGPWPMCNSFVYNLSADPRDVYYHGLNIVPITAYTQLNDPAIYHAFHDVWLQNHPPSPWFLALSFVNPHDMADFPWSYGLSSSANMQACGPGDNFNCAPLPNHQGFYPPPELGWNDVSYKSLEVIQFNGLAFASIYNTANHVPADWNYPDDPMMQPYNHGSGKAGLQGYYEYNLNNESGQVNNTAGWETFLNYYYWMQSTVDTLIGMVVSDINTKFTNVWERPLILFTSDHGDYGGSHSLHNKCCGLYDEIMNVPLMIHFRNQIANYQRDFVCSSVDMLPFIYAAALGNDNSWRQSADLIGYLANRESIFDAAVSNTQTQRRVAPYTNTGGHGATGPMLPYVLHMTDEPGYRNATIWNNSAVAQPSHAIGFRTLDNTVVVNHQAAGTYYGGGNYYGGGKLGMYSFWPSCSTYPVTSGNLIQFEFYDYYGGNYPELGNNAFHNGAWNAASAGIYLNSYNSIMQAELYNFTGITNAHSNAFSAYMTYFQNLTGGGACNAFSGSAPPTIPPPS